MFKFATNKFSHHGSNPTNNTNQLHNNNNNSGKTDESSSSRRRFQIQKDLFAFNKIADKGFPSKPSAMDYDKKLKLLAIGTRNGDIRIYGEPNTLHQQLSCYQDVHPFPIQRILFVQGQYQLITLSERVYRNDMTNKGESHLYLVLWQIPTTMENSNLVEKIKEYQLDPKIVKNTRLSAFTLLNDNSHLFLGFETGDVYVFNVSQFQLVPGVINKDYILKNIPVSDKKLTQLGPVESICHHPKQLTKLLIAYQRGLWVIFDFIKNNIDQIQQTQQQIESAVFYQQGECVATSHSDGSFILWDLTSDSCSSSPPNIVYGPYPCKAVTKCFVKTCKNDQPYVIFSGGCPRVNYSDKITISVIQGENSHVCFDFTSKIIDFFTIDKPCYDKQNNSNYDNPQALLVLLEEEFIAIDLQSDNWPQFKLPYLCSVHSSAIICTHYVNNVSQKFYELLKKYGTLNQEPNEVYSDREWPISSSLSSPNNKSDLSIERTQNKDLLLTGHEDGSVRFWDVTNMTMTLIYRLKTADYFQTDSTPLDGDCVDNSNEDNWPPFRKIGTFDPYSDDPKLGVQKLYLCPQKEILVIAGTAGQVLIMNLSDDLKEIHHSDLQAHKINIIGVSPEVESHFVWKGHEPLSTRGRFNNQPSQGSFKVPPGYQIKSLIQLYPPATVSALSLNTDWQLVAMGTSHGFALFDYNNSKDLLIRCTLDASMLVLNESGNGGNAISRRKSLKKSLRESFRKLRRGRSQKPNAKKNENNNLKQTINEEDLNEAPHKPIERQVESREFKQMDDIPPSVIRYMYFVRTYITNNQQMTNSLWVGTNTGIIYIYALQFIKSNINCLLAKEMRLKHRAPVVNIQVIDQHMQPLPFGEENIEISHNSEQNHKVIICSEEQFKVFQLPALKPVCKFKLTAVEGARVRRIGYNSYISKTDSKYSEYCLSCLSNLGDLSVYSLPQLKRQVQIQCMKQQDINAITSFVFTKQGQAFYLQSPSEFVHISMSARDSPQLQILTQTKRNTRIEPSESNINNQTSQQIKKDQSPNTKEQQKSLETKTFSSPPPVPAPRTTIDRKPNQTNNSNNDLKPNDKENLSCQSSNINNDTNNIDKLEQINEDHDHSISISSISSPNRQNLKNNSSLITNSGQSSTQLTSILNQSVISSINNQTQNSSGFNGSSTCVSNGNNITINMSMDSVVDRFGDDLIDVSTKKIPSVIDENSSVTNHSDSLFNETDSNDLTNAKFRVRQRDIKQNLNSNGSTANSEVTTDDENENALDNIPPQKSSSPMIPKINNSNQNTKIEQVTKRIESCKLEYRETAID
ncbi:unnamed protein product [Brachionus calyciflorus]|uniref:Lethal giant larvae homologue 2 domain-containing protein n=1 Tax=Brachionus calyciflorus TaxID=104777 RepID=A0A814B184_9BILA|nr:unnamed protein product [Brachionus calyciflorus]